MKEINFRIWHKKKAAWISDEVFLVLDTANNRWTWDWIDEQRPELNNSDIIVQQYTGLKDKNGKEIYEGDWINFHYKAATEGPFFVKYFEPAMQFVFDDQIEKREYLQDHAVFNVYHKLFEAELEVVGNMFI